MTDRFKELVHYICWSCNNEPEKLGAIKLNKILWYTDAISYLHNGQSITGHTYVKRPRGPVPARILNTLDELKAENKVSVTDINFYGRMKKNYSAHQEPKHKIFEESELRLVDNLIHTICDHHTADSISESTHNIIWDAAEEGEEIPLYAVFASKPGSVTEQDMQWADDILEDWLH